MKRLLAGSFVSLLGTIIFAAVIVCNGLNMSGGWVTPPGRFFCALMENGLVILFIISIVIIVAGLVLIGSDFFNQNQP
jgi:hypothetical protein